MAGAGAHPIETASPTARCHNALLPPQCTKCIPMSRPREYPATVTRQGQVTVPAELRRELGIDGGGRVRFVVDDAGIRFEAEPSIASHFGILPALPGAFDDFDREIDEAIATAMDEKHGRNTGR